jgi:hypothetical protein
MPQGQYQFRNDFETLAPSRSFQVRQVVETVQSMSMRNPLSDPAIWPQAIAPRTSYRVPSYVTIKMPGTAQAVEFNAAEMLILMARTYLPA